MEPFPPDDANILEREEALGRAGIERAERRVLREVVRHNALIGVVLGGGGGGGGGGGSAINEAHRAADSWTPRGSSGALCTGTPLPQHVVERRRGRLVLLEQALRAEMFREEHEESLALVDALLAALTQRAPLAPVRCSNTSWGTNSVVANVSLVSAPASSASSAMWTASSACARATTVPLPPTHNGVADMEGFDSALLGAHVDAALRIFPCCVRAPATARIRSPCVELFLLKRGDVLAAIDGRRIFSCAELVEWERGFDCDPGRGESYLTVVRGERRRAVKVAVPTLIP